LFFGRRIEQSFGGWIAHYTSFKTGRAENAFQYMPHERMPESELDELSFEDNE